MLVSILRRWTEVESLTIPDNIARGLHVCHATHDTWGIIAEGESRSVVTDVT